MDFYQSAKEELKRVVDIVELIGQFVELKKAGLNHLGLCPFHSEKAPSFTVNTSKQMFHCFGCKKGGDIFAFWMEYHKTSFPEAMRDLAEKYHVTLPEKKLSSWEREKTSLKESLFKLNETAAKYFHNILTQSRKGAPGKKYLDQRGVPEEIISEWRLGYVPNEWNGLTHLLTNKKRDLKKAIQAGLIIPRKNGGYYDRFRGRVMFPIFNLRKQIVGFGGRVLDDALPKYLNTPETPVFNKGELLYGLHNAYHAIRNSGRVIIVEGYTDVLALNRHGLIEVVATLGTALSKNHIRMLKGYSGEAIVVFDSDAAGMQAALRGLSLFLAEGMASRVLVLPDKEDPDSFISQHGLKEFEACLKKSVPIFDFYIDMRLSGSEGQIEKQVQIFQEMIPFLYELKSEAQRSFYIKRLAEKIGITESAVMRELRNWQTNRPYRQDQKGEFDLQDRLIVSKTKGIDDIYLLSLIIHYPSVIDRLTNVDFHKILSKPTTMEIFDQMLNIYKKGQQISNEAILERLGEESAAEFRQAMMMPPIFTEEMAEEALSGFEEKVHRLSIGESLKKAKDQGDLQRLNQELKLMKEKRDIIIPLNK